MTEPTEDELRLARQIIRAAHPDEPTWTRFYNSLFEITLAAIRETTERAAQLASVISSIHDERGDDCLRAKNHLGALTQVRNAQTAEHIAKALRHNEHLKEPRP